jgi:hypothetical protein
MATRPRNGDSDDNRRKRPANGDRGGRGGGYGGGQDGGDGGGEHEKGEAGEQQIFKDMVQRRMGGGAPPSAAAYARAMRQWQQMPGAVGFTAVPDLPDEPPPEEPPSGAEPGGPDDGQPRPPGNGGAGDGDIR